MKALWLVAALAAGPATEGTYTVQPVPGSASRAALLEGAQAAWSTAQHVTWGPDRYATTFAALWSADGLFVRFDAVDPEPWSTMARHDDPLWDEEVVEIFLDPARSGRDYAELEISPANVVCDVRMVRPSPDKLADLSWDLAGLETRVHPLHAEGSAKVAGWTAIGFLPWNGFRTLPAAARAALPPRAGDRWRFNVFRIERPGGRQAPEKEPVLAAWSPTGSPSFHIPGAFRDFIFANQTR